MTDRHAGYVITLKKDIRDEDARPILNAIRMIKGVISVEPVINTSEIQIAKSRALHEYRDGLYKMLENLK